MPGINIQWPWSELIANGAKKIETRNYPIPEKYLNREIALIETPGKKGRKNGVLEARITAVMVIAACYRYRNKKHWSSEDHLHLVSDQDPSLGYGQEKYAWVIESVVKIDPPLKRPKKRGIVFASSCHIPDKLLGRDSNRSCV